MIEVNLLPKEYLKKGGTFALGKAGLYGIGIAAGIVLLLISISTYQVYQLSELEEGIAKAKQRASVLQRDIQVVDALIDVKTKIASRMSAVERLDANRSAWVRILEDVARDVPEFVWLGTFKESAAVVAKTEPNDGDEEGSATPITTAPPSTRPVELEGYAFTLNALAAFMINMMRSDYFDEVELISTDEKRFLEDEVAYKFVLACNVHYLSDEDLRNLVAQAETKATGSNKHRTLN
ncbi:MAG: PilN domain-containing protein [candidate division Zixibacteria bacterium]